MARTDKRGATAHQDLREKIEELQRKYGQTMHFHLIASSIPTHEILALLDEEVRDSLTSLKKEARIFYKPGKEANGTDGKTYGAVSIEKIQSAIEELGVAGVKPSAHSKGLQRATAKGEK